MWRHVACMGVVLFYAPKIVAQETESHDHATERLGRVSFPVSCTPLAQRRFEHAMAVLHSFWWEEGDAAFSRVLEADPQCAMAYWGLAMNAWGNPFAGGPTGINLTRGAAAAQKARSFPARTPREAGFISAVSALYSDAASTSNTARLQAYADTMARLYRDFPEDTEVATYHALALVATAPKTDTTFAQQKRAAEILDPLFALHPDHPGLAHYVIHSTDSPQLAQYGLRAARRYARIAPSAPHAQHMPSHIFIRLGYWDETVASNQAAFRAGIASASARRTPPAGEQLHALDYAVYAHLQRGQDSAAEATVAVAQGLAIPQGKSLVGDYNRTAMAARIPLERGNWAQAARFPIAQMQGAGTQAMLSRFTRAIGAARSGNARAARAEVAALDSLLTKLAAEKKEPYWARVTAIKRDAARAWVLFAEGDTAGALVLARAAADSEEVTDKHPVTPAELLPARELEADMLLEAGRYMEARKAYQATLAREPGRARSLYGSARAAELAGNHSDARADYSKFITLMSKADGNRAELVAAMRYVKSGAASPNDRL
ncbi:MAG TPA: tetratricopeptide repeat protein [Gemmatimonadales bacterium]|nr:tetratricopeptide repeat protein [Gemmatimonadales bacterium]